MEEKMISDYSFKSIRKYLEKESKIGEDILNAFDSLTDAAIIFSPIIMGPQFLPLLDLLEIKHNLCDLGHKVYDAIVQRVEPDYVDRMEQIRAAYALISYTAYFDVLERSLSKKVRKKLKSKLKQKKEIIEKTVECDQNVQLTQNIHSDLLYADHINSFSDIKEHLTSTYERITNALIKIIVEESIFNDDESDEKQLFNELQEVLIKIPKEAIKVYEAQYISLADQFNDFAMFAQLQNFECLSNALKHNKNVMDLLLKSADEIDIGLKNLNSLVNSIATNYSEIQAQDIVTELKNKYIASINEPIIDDKEITSDAEINKLQYPKIVDAFIPQSYKCISYTQKGTKLENTTLWRHVPIQHDLDKFFVKYLYSPDSINYPLIILGQPGSGKSLLTKILSAQLMCESYTVIRIPLREVNADDGIDILVEDQIKKITNRPLTTLGYGGFASQFNQKPLVIILDGYDELLQAKGDVFVGYLEKIRRFQQEQQTQRRPVRIIVTSRITLIDKARIPENSTILRLMEFNQQQMQAWIDIWNNTNADYFTNSNIKPFNLPTKEGNKKNSIHELAEQPLLLLMLALYDSESNELAQINNIKRTELYDNLLRRFVRRERSRYVPGFADKSVGDQERIIDEEMKRLGVVAIGMYNRRDVVIHSEQLERDIEAYHAHRNDGSPEAHSLTEADSVLSGFFFIHKSTAQEGVDASDKKTYAYEFLHNTFGEFLAADFILRNTIIEVQKTFINRVCMPYNRSNDNAIIDPNFFFSSWFYCLMFVPLYSRPVIVEMLREHAKKSFERYLKMYPSQISMKEEDFTDNLKNIVKNQLEMVLNTRLIPKVMINGTLFDNNIPILGYLSTYTLNLVILASSISINGFEFNEDDYNHKSDSSKLDLRPWDKLASIWKSWFAPADLVGLSVILKAKRKKDRIVVVECNKKFESASYEQPIDVLLCISTTLADNTLIALSGLQTSRFREISKLNDMAILKVLQGQSVDFYVTYSINMLRREICRLSNELIDLQKLGDTYNNINKIIKNIIEHERIYSINIDTTLMLFEVIEICLIHHAITFSNKRSLVKYLFGFISDPHKEMNKLINGSIEASSVRLLRQLIPNGFPFAANEQISLGNIVHGKLLIDEEWGDDFEGIIHYSLRNYKDRAIDIQNNNLSKSFLMSLLDFIENSCTVRPKDKIDILSQFISINNLNSLLDTSPELPCRSMLMIIEMNAAEQCIDSHIIDIFFQRSLELIADEGIFNFGINSIINVIKIAKHLNAKKYIYRMEELLDNKMFHKNPDFLFYIVYQYPEYIVCLIDLMPKLFLGNNRDNIKILIKSFCFRKKLYYNVEIKKLLDYISVFKTISLCVEMESDYGLELLEALRNFAHFTLKAKKYDKLDFNQLTISQLDSLIWLSECIGDIEFSRCIKEKIKHSNICHNFIEAYYKKGKKCSPFSLK